MLWILVEEELKPADRYYTLKAGKWNETFGISFSHACYAGLLQCLISPMVCPWCPHDFHEIGSVPSLFPSTSQSMIDSFPLFQKVLHSSTPCWLLGFVTPLPPLYSLIGHNLVSCSLRSSSTELLLVTVLYPPIVPPLLKRPSLLGLVVLSAWTPESVFGTSHWEPPPSPLPDSGCDVPIGLRLSTPKILPWAHSTPWQFPTSAMEIHLYLAGASEI